MFGNLLQCIHDPTGEQREVARAQGYLEPKPFLAMFRFVAERAYEKGSLSDFVKTKS